MDRHSEIVRAGRATVTEDVLHDITQRTVTGVLSGAEIKHTFFDAQRLNWHAMAVLERDMAGRGALVSINQRLDRIRPVLAGCGKHPLTDYFRLQAVRDTALELHGLEIAVALFTPDKAPAVRQQIRAVQSRLQQCTAQAEGRIKLHVDVNGLQDGPADALASRLNEALHQAGLQTSDRPGAQNLHVLVRIRTEKQVGGVTIYKVASGAVYEFKENGSVVATGEITPGNHTAVRAGSEQAALKVSMERLQGLLVAAIARDVTAGSTPAP
jgi:hypothetical protein